MGNSGFELEITELRLGLPGGTRCNNNELEKSVKKKVFAEVEKGKMGITSKSVAVGWPPVCSYRRRRSIGSEKDSIETSKKLVKISMDGVPFLRKIDVCAYQEYTHFVTALQNLFGCSSLNEEALEDNAADMSEYVLIYEDKDGDWLLVGDVPWNMFVESCKRLRIMKSSRRQGL